MADDTHAPGPWGLIPGHSVIELIDANGKRIAFIGEGPYWKDFSGRDRATALLIVKAPAMLEALQECHLALSDAQDEMAGNPDHDISIVAACELACRKIRNILARVKGETND